MLRGVVDFTHSQARMRSRNGDTHRNSPLKTKQAVNENEGGLEVRFRKSQAVG